MGKGASSKITYDSKVQSIKFKIEFVKKCQNNVLFMKIF